MSTFIVEIKFKDESQDPIAKHVRTELIEAGEAPASAHVLARRLFRIEANLSFQQIETAAETLLVDPVIESASVERIGEKPGKNGKAPKVKGGWVLDIWPKAGVTDPVGGTVEKGLRDLGLPGPARAASAARFVFPKAKDATLIQTLAKRFLANELIHDIDVRKV